MSRKVFVMGSFVADLAFRMSRLPAWGETLMGDTFALGPGGKGSNQAVAAARAVADASTTVQFLSKVADDAFGRLARDTWAASGVDASLVGTCDTATGAAAILVDSARGENAIVVVPGACFTLTPAEVDEAAADITASNVFLTQLELALDTVQRGLELARAAGVPTILNPAPAPAHPLPDALLALSDYFIPNETEAALLTGLPVGNLEEAKAAARKLQSLGSRNIILTLGAQGALVLTADGTETLVASFNAGPVVETTGAGDAFCGGFATALAEGQPLLEAVRFGCATAGISVTRHGTAPSMPWRNEIETLLQSASSKH
jgi:ribokinase